MSISPEQAVLVALTVLALELVAVGASRWEDRTFRFLGAALLTLCLMVACDIFVTLPALEEGWGSKPFLDFFQLAFQAFACLFVILLIWLLRHVAGAPGRRAALAHSAVFAAFAALAIADAMAPADLFIGLRGRDWHVSPVYTYAFMPYILAMMVWLAAILFGRRRRAGAAHGRILGRLCAASIMLLLGGMLDLLVLVWRVAIPDISYSLIGMLGFGMVCTFLLTDRLVGLYGDRRRCLLETARVHGELGADEPLREIGRSATLVSDAIRENLSELRGKVESLRMSRAAGHGAELERIETARRRLERLATGILEFSRSGRSAGKAPVDPARLAADCIASLPPGLAARVRIAPAAGGFRPVPMDRHGMERVLLELIRNAFEAGAGAVEIRIRQGLGRTIFAVEDDGPGFTGALSDITKPFFTTRKGEGGIGLGAAICLGLMRGQGGSLRYYRRPGGGLVSNLVLPMEEQDRLPEPPAIALATGDAARMEDFLAACANLGVRSSLLADPGGAVRSGLGGTEGFLIVDGRPGVSPVLSEEALLELIEPAGA